jgi:hypothetical protein
MKKISPKTTQESINLMEFFIVSLASFGARPTNFAEWGKDEHLNQRGDVNLIILRGKTSAELRSSRRKNEKLYF